MIPKYDINESLKEYKIIYGDITDFDSVLDAIKDCDYVFNLAASISVPDVTLKHF